MKIHIVLHFYSICINKYTSFDCRNRGDRHCTSLVSHHKSLWNSTILRHQHRKFHQQYYNYYTIRTDICIIPFIYNTFCTLILRGAPNWKKISRDEKTVKRINGKQGELTGVSEIWEESSWRSSVERVCY